MKNTQAKCCNILLKIAKKSTYVFCFIYVSIFSALPVQVGVQLNPNSYFVTTDSTQYVLSQKQLGLNMIFRVGFDISKRVSVGLGAGFGIAKEDIKYAYYTYGLEANIPIEPSQRNRNVLENFKSETYKYTCIFNPYITYKIPFSEKIGLVIESGYRLKATCNDLRFSNERPLPEPYKANVDFFQNKYSSVIEFENSVYIRPGFYYDISPKFRFVLNYMSVGYAFGNKINQINMFESYLPHYLQDKNFRISIQNELPRITAIYVDRFSNRLGTPFNEFQFLYNLSSLHIGFYLKL